MSKMAEETTPPLKTLIILAKETIIDTEQRKNAGRKSNRQFAAGFSEIP